MNKTFLHTVGAVVAGIIIVGLVSMVFPKLRAKVAGMVPALY